MKAFRLMKTEGTTIFRNRSWVDLREKERPVEIQLLIIFSFSPGLVWSDQMLVVCRGLHSYRSWSVSPCGGKYRGWCPASVPPWRSSSPSPWAWGHWRGSPWWRAPTTWWRSSTCRPLWCWCLPDFSSKPETEFLVWLRADGTNILERTWFTDL